MIAIPMVFRRGTKAAGRPRLRLWSLREGTE
jgi:hypothetical protein